MTLDQNIHSRRKYNEINKIQKSIHNKKQELINLILGNKVAMKNSESEDLTKQTLSKKFEQNQIKLDDESDSI